MIVTMGDNEELEYLSTTRNGASRVVTKPEDEKDLPVLQSLQRLLDERIAHYTSIDALVLGDEVFTLEQQLAINAEVRVRLLDVKSQIDEVIQDVKDKYEQ